MQTTSMAKCGSKRPNQCAALTGVYTYMGNKWNSGASCGGGSGWCKSGRANIAGHAFCATQAGQAHKLWDHGGWTFYKVSTSDTSDNGVKAACLKAGLVVPCAGDSGCSFYASDCTLTSERGCGNPMQTTSMAKCGSKRP